MHYFVTGGAGFIGSNLVNRLLAMGHQVTVYDNLSTGFMDFLVEAQKSISFRFIEGELLDMEALETAMTGCDFVFHMAANADIRFGLQHPRKDLEQNTIATFNVLEAMRLNDIKKIAFPSTGPVYGEPDIFPTPENAPFPIQTSLYGASKLACEGLIQAYCEGFGFQGWIFRFVSILGSRYTHGHVFDFYKKLLANPNELPVLGDGTQRKSYLHVEDCIDAILLAIANAQEKVNIFNLGVDNYCEINDSIRWITEHMEVKPALTYAGGKRGWIGDSPLVFLDCTRMKKLGWQPKYSIEESIIDTVRFLEKNHWVLTRQ